LDKAAKKILRGQIFAAPRTAKLSASDRSESDLAMRIRLTPPGAPIFFVSLILAVAAVATLYTHVPLAGHYIGAHRFWVMAAAYAALLAGVLFEGL
jgi:hypothetical protein